MRVRFTATARADLARIRAWIARDNPERALSFVEELESRALALTDLPGRGPVVGSTRRGTIHKLTHGSYLIFYRVQPDAVVILRFYHGAQRSPRFT